MNKEKMVSIKWQDDFTTDSRFIYYGQGTRNEYRITRFGKGFPFFEEDNVVYVLSELEKLSLSYRELFTQSSVFLEKAAGQSVETNVIKGIGSVSRAAGSMIGKIPIVKKGSVDEILQENGSQIKSNAEKTEKNIVESLSKSRDPGTGLFMDKLKDIICIFNHTGEICCDEKRIYLITT